MTASPAPAGPTTRPVLLSVDHDQALLLLNAVRSWTVMMNCLTGVGDASDRDALSSLQETSLELKGLLYATVNSATGTVLFGYRTLRVARAALAAHQEAVSGALRIATPAGSPALGSFLYAARHLDHLLTETMTVVLAD